MNLPRHRRARGAWRQTLRRSALLTLACMVVMAGSNFKFDGARAGAATKQQSTKLSAPMRKASPTESQSAKPPKEAAQVAGITPESTNCPNKVAINPNTTVTGRLATGDCVLTFSDGTTDNTLYDEYTFAASAGQQVSISMSSTEFDTYLFLLKPSETRPNRNPNITIQNDDNCPPNAPTCPTDSRIPVVSGMITLPETGTYSILANVFIGLDGRSDGAYSLTLTFGGTGGTICPPVPTQIGNGQTINGELTSNPDDCKLASDNTRYDAYSFTAQAGQQVSITMTSSQFDPYLALVLPNGTIGNDGDVIATDNNSGGNPNAHIPSNTATGFGVLPVSGTYVILANAVLASQTGAYSLTLNIASSNCPTTPINFGQPVNGVSLAASDCRLIDDGSFVDLYTFSGTAGQQIAINMTPTTAFNAYLLLTAPNGTDYLTQGGVTSIPPAPLPPPPTNARIPATGFFPLPTTGTYTIYANTGAAGQTGNYTLALTLPAAGCTYTLAPASATVPGAGGSFNVTVTTQAGCGLTASQVTSNASWLTVNTVTGGSSGTVNYTAAPNGTGVSRTGTLSIAGQTFTVTQPELTPVTTTLQFSAANYAVGEGDGQATITVTRPPDNASGAAAVDYRTVDNDTFTVGCADTVNNRGAAFGRCDFATTVDTLQFAPGEPSKTFVVPIINDAHVEGNETFQVVLSNATGAALGTQTTATVTITDNDAAGQANPIFQTPFFVRQQYLDFLAREPEASEPWSRVLTNCADVNTGPDVPSGCDRIVVSGAFFGSPEFKDKGIYLIVFYRVAFNRLPTYAEFAVDLRGVTGTTPPETFAKRAAFATAFTQRQEFGNIYGALSDSAYVTALLARYNNLASITTIDPNNPDGTTKVTLTQNDLVTRLGSGTLTRAQALRAIVQSDQLSANAEATNAFVASQYYGYLRRTPDTGGFNGWVNYLATHPGDFRTMVNGFVNSIEYRLRFGPNAP